MTAADVALTDSLASHQDPRCTCQHVHGAACDLNCPLHGPDAYVGRHRAESISLLRWPSWPRAYPLPNRLGAHPRHDGNGMRISARALIARHTAVDRGGIAVDLGLLFAGFLAAVWFVAVAGRAAS